MTAFAAPLLASSSSFGANVIRFSFLLSLLVWGTAIMAVVVALVPSPRGLGSRAHWWIAFWTAMGEIGLALTAYAQFTAFTTGLQFEERWPWIPAIGVTYHLGVDGISAALLVLNGLVGLAAVLASWDHRDRPRAYFSLLLFAQAAASGVLAAQNGFLLLFFWIAGMVPVLVLVAGWGRRAGAARRLAAYWGVGAACLVLAVLLLAHAVSPNNLDLSSLTSSAPARPLQLAIGVLLLAAGLTRLPLVPVHGWVRDVFAASPAGLGVLVAGSVSRLGGYLLVRLLAGAEHGASRQVAPWLGGLAALTVLYAVLTALSAGDLRRLAARLALIPGGVAALGLAGLTPLSLDGTVMALFGGGLAAALLVGAAATTAERAGAAELGLAAGLASRMPKLTWLLFAGCLAVLGIPLLATFPAGVMVVLGSIRDRPWETLAVLAGLVLGAAAVARLMHRVAFGAPNPESPTPSDASLSESWYLGLLVGALLWVGLAPGGPKLLGVSLFVDQGVVNVVNSPTADLAAPYAPTPAPTPTPRPTPTPSVTPSPSPSP
jgi:proton-translocating NADH-quinone oxidoreductase chain M